MDGAHVFEIEFRDICWDSVLTEAFFDSSTIAFDLWQAQSIFFTQMVDTSQGLLCGGYTHEIIYVSGSVFDATLAPINADLSPYTLTETSGTRMEITGTLNVFDWLGVHKIIIKATNGKLDTSATARGNQGFFNSVFSPELSLEIVNPCLRSVVNGDGGLEISEISVPPGKTLVDLILAGPTDSASVTYGNGYDKCGELTYLW